MIDIMEVFHSVVSQCRSVDIAESDFKKLIYEDRDLHSAYKEWCHENGYTEKIGFVEYCNEYLDEEESIWDALSNDYE